jgi:hypothetical protein
MPLALAPALPRALGTTPKPPTSRYERNEPARVLHFISFRASGSGSAPAQAMGTTPRPLTSDHERNGPAGVVHSIPFHGSGSGSGSCYGHHS